MEIPKKTLFPVVGIFVLVACSPTEAWYKQVAGPSYYSVGRASGLLSGIRRSPYVRRAELEPSHSDESASNSVFSAPSPQNSLLKTTPVCVTHITPNLQSCKLLHEIKGSFVCRAHVFISPDSSDCERSRAVKLVPGLDDGTYTP